MMNGDFSEAEHFFNKALKVSHRFSEKAYNNLRELENRRLWASADNLAITSH